MNCADDSAELLKLTTYFGERDRAPSGLLGDALMDLYGRARIQMSVLLRGGEGFGAHHALRTDRLLSLSEDLPVVSVAVDCRERIEALLDPVRALQRGGLITLERARSADGSSSGRGTDVPTPVATPTPAPSSATKLTVYLGRQHLVGRRPAFLVLCELLHRRGFDGASVLLGVDGTRRGERARARFFSRNTDVPVMVVAVAAEERVAGLLPELEALLDEPLLTLERVVVCKRDGQLLARPPELPDIDGEGRPLWQKLMVYTSQSATHAGRPLSQQVVRRLRASGAAGATSLRGVWGFHGAHAPHGDRLLQLRRRVPALTIALDTPARIAASFALVDELTAEHGLVTSETVPVRLTQESPLT
jgi:PII-like signaling protein